MTQNFEDGFASGRGDETLRAHWGQYVPCVFSGRLDADVASEDRKAKKVLFKPVETFLCNGEPDEVFRQLKERDRPRQLCGKVFKMGEPTYSCRDCMMDPTCVLCIDCFQNSAHKGHRYKMSTSGGGGYCDCGDPEAWRSEPFCDIHKKGLDRQVDQNPVDVLPSDLQERAKQLLLYSVRYAVDMLTWETPDALPKDLQCHKLDNTYITMLFNDEIHTYEQVINTLQRAVDCTHKQAIDFATTVDREGRSNVKDGNIVECEKAKQIIEKQTSRMGSKPLRVLVMHTSVVSHQIFAQKILTWLQHVISQSDGLKKLFCHLIMDKEEGQELSVVERMMLADTKLWKAARIQSHQLFMAGVLMDLECKKQFSVIFTKWYPRLMRAFIEDDHDHSVCAVSESVQIFTVPTMHYAALTRAFVQDDHYRAVSATSCSVQIFTVPSLARMLITEHSLLRVILNTFLEECKSKKNKDGKFALGRDARSQAFRRAQYTLYDLKYALVSRPGTGEWNDKLRINFLSGFQALLELLKCMQGMDPVTRQTGQHIEFEPEWESAFNLQIKLAEPIAIILDWCGSDKTVLIDAFISIISALHDCQQKEEVKMDECTVGGCTTSCVRYDVSSQPLSIHLPVSRLLAGLYPQLNKFNVILPDIHKKRQLTPVQLIEPSLRTLVMIAQTQANMWRRNGYSLLNQIYFYHNVRCRTEMFDKDIIMLQAGAALIDSSEFIVHLINKFGLINWAQENYDQKEVSLEDSLRQIITLAEEFLNLLIVILSERHLPYIGKVTADDAVKKEIIQQLCIQPMAHSELTKSLTEGPYRETGIEGVLQEIAIFKKPTGPSGKGLFELKEEYYRDYNPFFYHYIRAEQSKSEEAQRKRKKLEGGDQALPPPVPPPLLDGFAPITDLLHCDVMIFVLKLVLQRTSAKRSKSWSETQFEKVLHLIGLALHEEKRAHENGNNSFQFIEKATCGSPSIFDLLRQCAVKGHSSVSHEAQKDLLAWVIKYFGEVRQERDITFAMESVPKPTTAMDENLEKEKKRKTDMAAKRRARIMAQISKMQRDFIRENADLFEETMTDLQSANSEMDISEQADHKSHFPVALGQKKSSPSLTGVIRQTCILCQEEQDVTHCDRAMVYSAFVLKSTVLSKNRGRVVENAEEYDPLFMPADLMMGAHTSTCGHVMHADCWQKFFDAIVVKERRRTLRFRQHLSYDIEKNEFLCPLCETLSNTVIPIIPQLPTLLKDCEKQEVELSLNDWLDGIQKTVRNSIQEARDKESEEESFLFVPCPLSSITKMMAESVAKNFQLLFDYVYDDASAHFSDSITEMLRKFSTDAYATGLGVHPDDENIRVPIMAWSTCAYTIMAVENILRYDGKALFGALPSRQGDCLSATVRFAAVCSQVIQPDIVRKHCVTLLSALVMDSADKHLQDTPCVLDLDMFHYLVELCLALPTLYAEEDASSTKLTRVPTGGLNDLHALQLVFTAHLLQVMLSAEFRQEDPMDVESTADAEDIVKIYQLLRQKVGMADSPTPHPYQLLRYIKEASLPFLRCAAIFFYHLTSVRPPEPLYENSSEEFDIICQYLSLPDNLSVLFSQSTLLSTLIDSWCSDNTLRKKLAPGSVEKCVQYPRSVNNLLHLPGDYSELINNVSTFTCPKSEGDDSRAPTMCLICGQMLCSQSYCCQTEMDNITVGAATAHAHTCGAGTGMFLRVRECQVLLLSGRTKGCFFAPPYLDDYGETDQGLRRGNPLHLCADRYNKLQTLWLNHRIPEEIAHHLESNSNLMAIDWQHL